MKLMLTAAEQHILQTLDTLYHHPDPLNTIYRTLDEYTQHADPLLKLRLIQRHNTQPDHFAITAAGQEAYRCAIPQPDELTREQLRDYITELTTPRSTWQTHEQPNTSEQAQSHQEAIVNLLDLTRQQKATIDDLIQRLGGDFQYNAGAWAVYRIAPASFDFLSPIPWQNLNDVQHEILAQHISNTLERHLDAHKTFSSAIKDAIAAILPTKPDANVHQPQIQLTTTELPLLQQAIQVRQNYDDGWFFVENNQEHDATHLVQLGLLEVTSHFYPPLYHITPAGLLLAAPHLTQAEQQALHDLAAEPKLPILDWDLYPGRNQSARAKRTTLRRLADKAMLTQIVDQQYNKRAMSNGPRYYYDFTAAGRQALAKQQHKSTNRS